ncbi:H+transporting two-sector ATPase alpha/beta subunit central region [Desulfarculus baarsii DSM 2075]|uniref:V-type ATP synthase beta chain n=1 Tax=Desulfarculus baarsii (strain ATCC 33931 / DSM 2075 / LMG 7858 / VKM B-1802 / 2st14) TaxID=644282 RepID=E1QGX2_DESB2|nr:V-type ATP synthase subunit B [Desulfarculus baarsii]ADK84815.1 H+transporting two-sector ATPase alpha/beta subunit central region [Desulfarculus baarsii DSM 2075]
MRSIITKIKEITGNIATLEASGVGLGELAVVQSPGQSTLGQVIRVNQENVTIQVFGGTKGISTSDQVRFLGHPMQVKYGPSLMGRIFNGSGVPIDGGPEPVEEEIAIGGPSFNPANRIIPQQMIRTNIPMIDLFNSLVVSQKLPIFSIPGEPYNQLLARVGMQAEADIIILGGMGLKFDDFTFFKRTFEESGVMNRVIMFIHQASDPVVECLLVPDMALAVAERFAEAGQRVLVLLTDMTNFADSLKEISISMEQIPSNRGYPGDLYSQLASRYEKAVDIEGAGGITLLAVTTMPGDDVTHPVPDNTGYITEGQFYLRHGVIDPFGSLSRLKQNVVGKVTRKDHNDIMNTMIRLYSDCRESRNKIAMGFKVSKWDETLLAYGKDFETELMDLNVNLPIEQALDRCWTILARHFDPVQTGLKQELVDQFWPKENKEAQAA